MKNPRIVIEMEDGEIQAIYGTLTELDVKIHTEILPTDGSPPEEVEYSYDPKHVNEVFDENTES